ncbi:MAG: ABC transporter permease [Anaerolineae bacterium]|nr:ABC transporter permease [Anaerolineae bacterium]
MTTSTQSIGHSSPLADLRALWAVVRREWLYFVRYPSWIIALIIWPLIFPMAYLLTGRALAGPDGSGMAQFQLVSGSTDFFGYVAIGTTIWMWQNIVLWNVGFSLRNEQMRGTLESNWLSPTWRFAYLLGSTIPQVLQMLMLILVSALEFSLLFGVRFDGSLWLSVLMILATIPSIYGLGFAFASLVITVKEANAFVFLVRGMVMIFCGITFPISLLPGWMQSVALWMPQTYAINGMRLAAMKPAVTVADVWPDIRALLLFGAFWLVVGYTLFNWMERRARRTGAIGQY